MPKRLAVLWTLLIFIALSIPGRDLPGSGPSYIDKLAHLVLFAGLGVFWMHATLTKTRSSRSPLRLRTVAFAVLIAGLGYGILLELYQRLLPMLGRSAEAGDVAADALGLLLAVLLYTAYRRWRPLRG